MFCGVVQTIPAIDYFVVEYGKNLCKGDFVYKTEKYGKKKGVREYLKDSKTRVFNKKLDDYFQSKVNIPRKVGKRQELSTLISEECLILAKFIRNERTEWTPRIVNLT